MNRVRHTCFVYVHTSALKKKLKQVKKLRELLKNDLWKRDDNKLKMLMMRLPLVRLILRVSL
jgi:hypothetical protein